MRFAWLRLFSSYGPGDDPGWMIPYLILELLKGKTPALTKCEQLWDYIYASDVADAICRVASTPTANGFFNLGSGEAPPLSNTVKTLRDAIDPSLPLGIGQVPYRPDQVMHLQANNHRLRSLTGWQPNISLEEGLLRTVEWFRENRERYNA
jgi:nucleoside-diphosphate-sugar epimerase